MKFNSALQKEMEEGRKMGQEDQRLPRDKVWLHLHVCSKDILEKKWDKLCEMKEEIRKVVVGSDLFSSKTTKITLITLKLASEPLFFFAFEFLQNDRLNSISFCDIYFGITITATTL